MDTVRKTVLVPEDHQLRLDVTVPAEVPTGETEVTLAFLPISGRRKRLSLSGLAGRLRNSPLCARDPVELQRELRDEWH